MTDEDASKLRKQLYLEGPIVEVERASNGYVIGVKKGMGVEYFHSSAKFEVGKRIRVWSCWKVGAMNIRLEFEEL